jgi:predicted MFS family arabinose efflux permease
MTRRWAMLAVVFVTRTSMGFQFQSIASVAPHLVSDLGLSYAKVGTLVGLFTLPGAVFALPGGMLGQRFGERRVVVASLGLMAVGGAVTAASGSFLPAAAGRLVSGAGAVLMNILLAKMIADWFVGAEVATAMAVMLTSWPVGLGLAVATLGRLASWRTAVLTTTAAPILGLVLMLTLYRDPPRGGAGVRAPVARLPRRDFWLSLSGGFAWGCFNASLVSVVAFGPGVLIARGASMGDAGFVVSLALWVTIVSVPVGGLVSDRIGRPNLLIVGGSLVATLVTMFLPVITPAVVGFCLLGLVVGAPPGPMMSLLPKTLAADRLATGFGVYYTVFYLAMTITLPAAGRVRDVWGDPAAPILFAGLVMAATVPGLAIFRRLERATAGT